MNEIFEQLVLTSSRLEKESILSKHKDDDVLKQVVFLALDPFTQFYVRKIPKYNPNSAAGISLKFALDSLSDLSSRRVTGNAAIAHLTDMLEALNLDNAKVIERIISKDLKCGASVSTVNKIWPDLIHEYPCMLCATTDEKLINNFKFPAMIQLKMDGMRFNAIVKNGKVEYRSRNGKEIQGINHLDKFFSSMAGSKNYVFDGELVVKNDKAILDRQTGNGILNKAVRGTITAAEALKVCATLWDVISYEDFTTGYSSVPYRDRFTVLEKFILDDAVALVEHQMVEDIAAAREAFDSYLAAGQEGIILKAIDAPWQDKRVKHQIKFKGELECDLKVTGWQEGTGKYQGLLGALIGESSDGMVVTAVGTGFTDELRQMGKEVIGKIMAVKYNARIKDKNSDIDALFLPVFLEIREDKTEADSEFSIK